MDMELDFANGGRLLNQKEELIIENFRILFSRDEDRKY